MKAMHGYPKFRIKIPKSLVVNKMQRKFHFHVKGKATAGAGAKHGNQFSSKSVGSGFLSVLGNKRSLGKYASKVKKKELLGDSGDGKEWHITARVSSNELGNNLACGVEPVVAALSQLLTLEKALEPDRAGEGKQNRKGKIRVKMNLPPLSFLEKKKGWNSIIRAKMRKVKFSNDANDDDDVVTRFRQLRRKASSWHLRRIPLKTLVIRLKLKMIRSMKKKKVAKQCEQGADENGDKDEDRELCKKRILVGRRCKPLCASGTLSYDADDLFLPDIVP